jgi:hypothetical protein
VRAAAIAGDLIAGSGGAGGPQEQDALRALLRIGFELEAFLGSAGDRDALEWMHDTLFSGLESINVLRPVWRTVSFLNDPELAGAFPIDPSVVREDLAKAWRAVQQKEGAVSIPGYLRDSGPGPDTFPIDRADVHRQLVAALHAVEDRALPIEARFEAVHIIARLQLLFLGATLW